MAKLISEYKFDNIIEIYDKLTNKQQFCINALLYLHSATVKEIMDYITYNNIESNVTKSGIYSRINKLLKYGLVKLDMVKSTEINKYYEINLNAKSIKIHTNIEDLSNKKFGRLTVIKFLGLDNYNQAQWMCECDCGNERQVKTSKLTSGVIISCGCLNYSTTSENKIVHGMANTIIYKRWAGIKGRCCNPKNHAYKDYGGRGIKICDEWKEDFVAFYSWAMENGYNENLSIDRIDVNGNYTPDNCRWVTSIEQQNNTRHNILLTVNGVTHTVAEWAKIVGVTRHLIYNRLANGWQVNEDLFLPPLEKGITRKTRGDL
jgi:hypothetical protein